MNEIDLIFPTKSHEIDAKKYFEEHILNGENCLHGDSGIDSAEDYDKWLEKINDDLNREICSIVFFAYRRCDQKLIGTINLRYPYQGYVQVYGHIGFGIRPSERKKGYATKMLKLALEYGRKIGLERVLLTCDKTNIASAKTIIKMLGIFEKEEKQSNGELLQRYWIEL